MQLLQVQPGSSPVIIALPHTGTYVPPAILARLNENGQMLADTDWHIDQLYADLLPNATTVRATHHRYVIDVNRDPEGVSLYPGQNTTALVPVSDFDNLPIWRSGQEPTTADIVRRTQQFHAPYHAALATEIDRIKALHGVAIVYDCHSIRSAIPFLFDGVLPDFNIGTDQGRTCAPAIEAAAVEVTLAARHHSSVLNGRFRGGWTTRHYGHPETGVHAIQMELAQSTYLAREAPPFAYDVTKAQAVRLILQTLLRRLEAVAPSLNR